MSRISPTGKGLNIVLLCEYTPSHDWMSFASWYSVYHNLPDAQLGIFCKRIGTRTQLFQWTFKCKVPFIQYSSEYVVPEGAMVITPDTMAVTTYDETALGPIDVKSDENSTFVSYLGGCGQFVLSEWINTSRNPFNITSRLYSNNLSVNEYRVFKLWDKCHKFYVATT